MESVWEFYRTVGPDIENRLALRWYWRLSREDYVATSLGGFDDLVTCVRNAREHGMNQDEAVIWDSNRGNA